MVAEAPVWIIPVTVILRAGESDRKPPDSMNRSKPPLLSVVIPCFNEGEGIVQLARALEPVLEDVDGGDYEVLVVDDGSRDETANCLQAWRETNPRVRIIRLARNFGKEAALTCGLHFAAGQAVVVMDADLQDPPELIPSMLEKWREGFDVVLARRRMRNEDGWFKRLTATLFYRLMNRLAGSAVPPDVGDYRLMDRRVVAAIARLPENTRFMKGLMNTVGFRSTWLYYDRPARASGRSKWGFWRLWNLAIEGITSFSTLPLRVWSYIGIVFALFGLAYAAFIVLRTLIHGVDVPGYASIVTLILFFSGLQLISIGIIGEYLARVVVETKNRPLYVVDWMEGMDPDWVARRSNDILGNIVVPAGDHMPPSDANG